MSTRTALAIHGGAGTLLRDQMSHAREAQYTGALREALLVGEKILLDKGLAIDAVEAVVKQLEDNPLFNAGRGSVFTHEGKNEMDASIMEGKSLMAGAISGVTNVKNPITLARTVMENTEHVFLSGDGAVDFAKKMGIILESDDYFFVQHRYDQLQRAKANHEIVLDHTVIKNNDDKKFGTVGAVALDAYGNLAAATSTGGMTNKQHGRIGDSPIIGAGTYANNSTCAVSCTGHGEFFMRSVVAYDVSCLMEYKGLSLKEACNMVVHQKLVKLGGEGGLIAVDSKGNIEMPFNTKGMYRGSWQSDGEIILGIYE